MEPPIKPSESDCCNSGCTPCILDVYEEQLRKYEHNQKQTARINSKNCISLTSYTTFRLVNKKQHTKDCFLFTFRYDEPDTVEDNRILKYDSGQHFLLKGENELSGNRHFTRAYTPIPLPNDNISFTILVRLYDQGKMSKYLNNLPLNSKTSWRGPYGSYSLTFTYHHILFIAQGTGIAPIYAVLHSMLQNDACETFLKLFFCCHNSEDILLHDELYELSCHWNFTYKVFLGNSEIGNNVKYNEIVHARHLCASDIETYFNEMRKGDFQVCICGSDKFSNAIRENVLKCNIAIDKVYIF